MVATGQEMFDTVVFFHLGTGFTPRRPVLRLEGIHGHPFDISLFREQNQGFFVGD